MPSDGMGAGPRCGSREHREVMRALAEQLRAAGLKVRTLSYAGTAVDPDELIEEIEVINPASPGRGTFRVCEDAGVTWEYWAKLDSDQDAKEIAATITALLAKTTVLPDGPPG